MPAISSRTSTSPYGPARYQAGLRMGYAAADPGGIAAQIGRDVSYRPVWTDRAARAASFLAALV